MHRIVLILLLLAGLPAQAQDALRLPSGARVVPLDTAATPGGVRLRFTAPVLARDPDALVADAEALVTDMRWLCHRHAAASPAAQGAVLVTLLDRPRPVGQRDPQAVKLVEAFTIRDGECALDAVEFDH